MRGQGEMGACHNLFTHISYSCIHDNRNFNTGTVCTELHTNMTSTVEDISAVARAVNLQYG